MAKLEDLTDIAELRRLLEAQESGQARAINIEEMKAHLTSRVKGQDHVIDDLCRTIKLQWAKQKRKRPIANLLFVGPPGTGKTELAKAIAEYLYNDEKALIIYDGSDLSGPESKVRLIGTPTGYVGSEKGGDLTRKVINNPKRVICFDEVDKAYKEVLDVFLQVMGDGRLQEQGSGETADFTQAIIILTSNAEHQAIGKMQEEITDYHEMVNAVKSHLASAKMFRPEILSRIDRVYAFKQLGGWVMAEITVYKMQNAAKSYGLELSYIDPRLIFEAMKRGDKLSKFGIRELDREIDSMFGDQFIDAKEGGAKRIRLDIDDEGIWTISPSD